MCSLSQTRQQQDARAVSTQDSRPASPQETRPRAIAQVGGVPQPNPTRGASRKESRTPPKQLADGGLGALGLAAPKARAQLYRSSSSSAVAAASNVAAPAAGAAGAVPPPTPPSGNLKDEPKPRDCWSVWENISYLRMSLSFTERRANFIDSSKCALVISGTGSTASSVSIAASPPAAAFSFSSSISFSIDSRIAILAARWQISVRSAPEKPCSVLER
mmetsp:Transcript_40012/g.110128  ORF Transcript_40012/g.110128 Transcript_40012/m.110128 type:complete len:218 (+) Transcript_40012:45-698(+)